MRSCEVKECGVVCQEKDRCLLFWLSERLKNLEDKECKDLPLETATEYLFGLKELLEKHPDCFDRGKLRLYLVARRVLPETFATTLARFAKLKV